jgi:hypothetical protein
MPAQPRQRIPRLKRRQKRRQGRRQASTWAIAGLLASGVCAFGSLANAGNIEIVNVDPAGQGLNDPTPVEPIGGNPGRTLGEQRLNVLEFVARIYESRLDSSVVIQMESSFPNLACAGGAVLLGQGGAADAFRNFSGGMSNTWYGSALADAIAGRDIAPGEPDIEVLFNAALDNPTCLGSRGWYYGLDGLNGNEPDLARTVLHEVAHGLGFQTLSDIRTGAFFGNSPDIYSMFTFDADQDKTWSAMNPSERVASAENYLGVGWIGENAIAAMEDFTISGTPLALASAPPSATPDLTIMVAETTFAPTPEELPVSGLVVAAWDNRDDAFDGCEALLTPVAGKIALLNEGDCDPGVQAANAADAGAIAVLIASTVEGAELATLSGSAVGANLIPVVKIQKDDADWLRLQVTGGDVQVVLHEDAEIPLGAHPDGFPLLYSPSNVAPGSSLSHWSTRFTPSLLREPFADGGAPDEPDMTIPLLRDIGWRLVGEGGGGGTAGEGGSGGASGDAGGGGASGDAGDSGDAGASGDENTPPAPNLTPPPSGGGGCSVGRTRSDTPWRSDLAVALLGLLLLARRNRAVGSSK